MDESTPSHAAEVDALRQAYAALNRNDIEEFVAAFDPQIERVERIRTPEFPGGRTYHGLKAVKAHVEEGRRTWAEGGCEPERFLVAGDKILAFVHVRVRLTRETEWREGHAVDVYTYRNGRFVQFHTFVDEREALKWAGVEAPDKT